MALAVVVGATETARHEMATAIVASRSGHHCCVGSGQVVARHPGLVHFLFGLNNKI